MDIDICAQKAINKYKILALETFYHYIIQFWAWLWVDRAQILFWAICNYLGLKDQRGAGLPGQLLLHM